MTQTCFLLLLTLTQERLSAGGWAYGHTHIGSSVLTGELPCQPGEARTLHLDKSHTSAHTRVTPRSTLSVAPGLEREDDPLQCQLAKLKLHPATFLSRLGRSLPCTQDQVSRSPKRTLFKRDVLDRTQASPGTRALGAPSAAPLLLGDCVPRMSCGVPTEARRSPAHRGRPLLPLATGLGRVKWGD